MNIFCDIQNQSQYYNSECVCVNVWALHDCYILYMQSVLYALTLYGTSLLNWCKSIEHVYAFIGLKKPLYWNDEMETNQQ